MEFFGNLEVFGNIGKSKEFYRLRHFGNSVESVEVIGNFWDSLKFLDNLGNI